MTVDFRVLHAFATADWRRLGADGLLALLVAPLPWDVRHALAGDRLVVLATVPLLDAGVGPREGWLAAAVEAVAAGDEVPAGAAADEDQADGMLATVRWLATGKGWRLLDAEGPGLRLAVPGEHDLPPIAVWPCPAGLHIERPLPLLPARHAEPVVRLAVAHAALVLNGHVRAARLAVRDPQALTFAVEVQVSHAPLDDPDEDTLECALEGVRHAAAHATGVLDCLRNPAVAREYATAHNLPAPLAERGLP